MKVSGNRAVTLFLSVASIVRGLRGWSRVRKRRIWVPCLAVALTLCAAPVLVFELVARAGHFDSSLLEPSRASSLTVLDGMGGTLRQMATSAGGRQSFVPLDRISGHLVDATLVAEDRRFFDHKGVDSLGVARAIWLDLCVRRPAYGASTISMQLARILEPLARGRRKSFADKLHEAIAARRLERVLTKHEILEQYLNRAYYGNGVWGVEAAAEHYFGKHAADLSLGESAFVAVMPRSPARYNPYRHLPATLARRQHILELMEKAARITPEERDLALRTPLGLRRDHPDFKAPHFVDYVLSQLRPADREGTTIQTTLDLALQQQIEVSVRDHLEAIGSHVSQAAVLVLRNSDGAVLSMIGSPDYFDAAHAGAANAITSRRRPGSTLKPFVYGIALERGDTPASMAFDVVLPDEVHESYTNEVKQHGFARYRESLAGSYNLAAIHTLRKVGPASLAARLKAAGLTTLAKPDGEYGPGLAVGEVEVRLLELAAAFAAIGNGGKTVVPHPIERILGAGKPARSIPVAPGKTIFAQDIAYLIFDILSDSNARRPMFGDLPPVFPFPVALKTGTTRAYTDNWAFGVTREFTVGVWAGNFDGKPTDSVMAMQGAAPLVRAAYVALAARYGDPTPPMRPDDIVEADVCAVSGMLPGPHCKTLKHEIFRRGTVPNEPCTWHTVECGRPFLSYPTEVRGWAHAHGLLHRSPCGQDDEPLRILFPVEGARFLIDPGRPLRDQIPPLRASPTAHASEVEWTIDGEAVERFRPSRGEHEIRAAWHGDRVAVQVQFE